MLCEHQLEGPALGAECQQAPEPASSRLVQNWRLSCNGEQLRDLNAQLWYSSVRRSLHPYLTLHDYPPSQATLKNPHSSSSAAFASSSNRFPKTRPAAGDAGESAPSDMGSVASQSYQHVGYAEPLGGWHGGQKSAAFSSTSRRLPSQPTISPGPGAYTPRASSAYSPRSASNVSAAYASSSARKLPFEQGGGRGTDIAVPPPTRYQPSPSEEYRGRGSGPSTDKAGVSAKAAASMRLTSPRFSNGHYNHTRNEVPGPGSYRSGEVDRRTISSAYSTTGRKLPLSTSERRLQFDVNKHTPGADHYSPASSMRGMGQISGRHDEFVPTASFRSASKRLKPHQTLSPGPGAYAPVDGLATSSQVERPRIRRSASFGSSSKRFATASSHAPGPGAYHSGSQDDSAIASGMRSPRRGVGANNSANINISASFASGSERTQLPTNRSARSVPGPGAHEHSNPVADYARPLRRSASFASTSSRLKGPPRSAQSTPPPGAYDPRISSRTGPGRAYSSATQRYSMTGDTRGGYRANLG